MLSFLNDPEVYLDLLLNGAIIAGGALGACLSGARLWKGPFVLAIATLAETGLMALAGYDDDWLAASVIFLVVVGLVGGRWGLGLTIRQLFMVVLAGFLVGLSAGFVAAFLLPDLFAP